MLGYGIRFEMCSGNALSNAYCALWPKTLSLSLLSKKPGD